VEARNCTLCGELLGQPVMRQESAGMQRGFAAITPQSAVQSEEPSDELWGYPAALVYLLIGLPLAFLFGYGPLLSYMGWFLSSLCHELGHTTVAWFFGMPAFPAIRLDGHAASQHREQIPVLCWAITVGLAAGAWQLRHLRVPAIALGISALLYPLFAFTSAKEVLFLLGGHLGELAMATICFWRAMSGGFSDSKSERGLYAVVAWYLSGSNFLLCQGLAFSGIARSEYAGNGSFGLTNDYIRLAEDVMGTGLATVGFVMMLVSLLPLPLAWLIRRFGSD
jgi:hypothetical protein